MEKVPSPAGPSEYLDSLQGWQQRYVQALREVVTSSKELVEVIKWGHLVYLSNGPVLLIRAETERVLFGFWRGKRLRDIEPRLKPGGMYEMASLELREQTPLERATVAALVKQAVLLNAELGDPTNAIEKLANNGHG